MGVLDTGLRADTPMGANLSDQGVTFRTWAPHALDVHVVTDPAELRGGSAQPDPATRLIPDSGGMWRGFVPGLHDGDPYMFWIKGTGSQGFKRDPYARELGTGAPFPNCSCLIRDPSTYPWHDGSWNPPEFSDLVVYQFHVGSFYARDPQGRDVRSPTGARFLDVIGRIEYLCALGINAIEPLPIQEFPGPDGLGYSGTDYFSPEMVYQIEDGPDLARHLVDINQLLGARGQPPMSLSDIRPGANQLKCLIDLCHLYGIAVILDVVYNHAGGPLDDGSLAFYDRQSPGGAAWSSDPHTLFFGNGEHAGGLVFNFAEDHVRQFLIDNAKYLLDEFHVDGFRYDRADVIADAGGGRRFCEDLVSTLRYHRPKAIQIAEWWSWDRATPVLPREHGGLGFDAAWSDRLRDSLRAVLRAAQGGADSAISMDAVRDAFYPPPGFPDGWRAVHHLENHDLVYWDPFTDPPGGRDYRIAALADQTNHRSWYAQGRSRVVSALLLAAPGIPMLFMGQEFLEDKPWSDDVAARPGLLIWWDGLEQDKAAADFLRFMQDVIRMRRERPALRSESVRVSRLQNADRIIVIHRWVERKGLDLVVIANLKEEQQIGYAVGLPFAGRWYEIFNSDYYQDFPNPSPVGNGGSVIADGAELDGFGYSATLTIPPLGVLVLARDPH